MKKIKNWCLVALSIAMFSACSDGDDASPVTPPDEKPDTEIKGEMKSKLLSGVVRDTDGNPLSDVTVKSGLSTSTTNEAGLFSFDKVNVVSGRMVVRFSKDGYFDVVRSLTTEEAWDVVLCKKENNDISQSIAYASSKAQELKAAKMKIEMPEDGYMVDKTGKPYTGQVNAEVVYLDPNNENFAEMMPGGDLSAIRSDGSDAKLLSYGMTAVNMTDANGNKLQLKEGASATLTFPIPEGMDENLPASIPLWSFNEATGVWEEEGVATLQGDVYVGQVKHFSWVNLDYPEEQAVVEGYVKDVNGKPVKNVRLHIGQVSLKTDDRGYYRQDVVAETPFDIIVKSQNYGNYRNEYRKRVPALAKQETRRIDIELPAIHTVSGRIVNKAGGANIATLWIKFDGPMAPTFVTKNDGIFYLYAPEGYIGSATLNVLTLDGDVIEREITLGGGDVNVGDIVISSEVGDGGQVTVRLSDGTTAFMEIENPGMESFCGVIVVDDRLMVVPNEESDENRTFYLQLDGYSPSKKNYQNGLVSVTDQEKMLYSENSTDIVVNRKSDKFVFDLDGIGAYMDEASGKYDMGAKYTANRVTIDLAMIAKTFRNVQPKQVGLPAFTPVLASAAPLVMNITEGDKRVGTGGAVYYNGSFNDFKTLEAQADKSGIKKVDVDGDDEGSYRDVMYFSNNKYIMLSYYDEGTIVDEDFTPFADDDPQIMVTVLENVSSSILFSRTAQVDGTAKIQAIKKMMPFRKLHRSGKK